MLIYYGPSSEKTREIQFSWKRTTYRYDETDDCFIGMQRILKVCCSNEKELREGMFKCLKDSRSASLYGT